MDLTAKLNALTPQPNVGQRDEIIRQMAEDQVAIELSGSFALPTVATSQVARMWLPELPANSKWLLGAATAIQSKLVTTGTSGTTTMELETESGTKLVDLDVANTDGDDTYVNGASIATTRLEGGQYLYISVSGVATNAVGPVTVRVSIAPSKINTSGIVDLQ